MKHVVEEGRYLVVTSPKLQGEDVKKVQQGLSRKGFSPGPIHGEYDTQTSEAVREFQKRNKLMVTGNVGRATYFALLGYLPKSPWPVEELFYSNLLEQKIEPVWYERAQFYAVELGQVVINANITPYAEEYVVVYKGEREGVFQRVAEQLNIYDSIPGQPRYSPIWRYNYVLVPPNYQPNSLRSAEEAKNSGYQIITTELFEN